MSKNRGGGGRPVKPWVEEEIDGRPGVLRIRATVGDESGTVEAERTRDKLCTVCLQRIGADPFIRIEGIPKHYRHVLGQ